MSNNKPLSNNNQNNKINIIQKLKHLESQTIELLETFLNDDSISIEEREMVKSQIIEVTKKQQSFEQQKYVLISDDWKKWIIENKLLNVSDQAIIDVMVKNGFDMQTALQAINNIAIDNSFQSESKHLQQLRKLESILEVNRKLAKLSPVFGKIERRKSISQSEFLENYYAKNTPLILTEMMHDWQAMSWWSPEFFKTNYGNCQVEITSDRNSDPDYEINTYNHKKVVTMSQYVDMIVNGGETNDYYINANNKNLEQEEFKPLLKDIKILPEFLDSNNTSQRIFFWFGPAGTITPLHHDTMNLMMAHVYGRKRWRLISPNYSPLLYNDIGVFSKIDLENPNYNQYPLFKDVDVIETILEPGEIIFVPVGWWHQVKGLDTNIAVSFTNFIFPN